MDGESKGCHDLGTAGKLSFCSLSSCYSMGSMTAGRRILRHEACKHACERLCG